MKDLVQKTANLAAIKISDEEAEIIGPQFERIIDYMAAIDELDLDGIEPMTHVNEDQVNITRDDKETDSLDLDDALQNAPKRNEQFFKAPKVLD